MFCAKVTTQKLQFSVSIQASYTIYSYIIHFDWMKHNSKSIIRQTEDKAKQRHVLLMNKSPNFEFITYIIPEILQKHQ